MLAQVCLHVRQAKGSTGLAGQERLHLALGVLARQPLLLRGLPSTWLNGCEESHSSITWCPALTAALPSHLHLRQVVQAGDGPAHHLLQPPLPGSVGDVISSRAPQPLPALLAADNLRPMGGMRAIAWQGACGRRSAEAECRTAKRRCNNPVDVGSKLCSASIASGCTILASRRTVPSQTLASPGHPQRATHQTLQ